MRFDYLVLGAVLMSMTSAAQQSYITTLATLKNNARPLLIFASKPDDPQLEIQIRILKEHAPDVHDRDIVPVGVIYNNPSPTEARFTQAEAETIRRRFNVRPSEFTVVLIGKDGGEKLKSSKPLTIQKINDTIDAMPMRKDEMKRHN